MGNLLAIHQHIAINCETRQTRQLVRRRRLLHTMHQPAAMRLDQERSRFEIISAGRGFGSGLILADQFYNHAGAGDGMGADRRFRRQDQAINTIDERVIDVIDLGAGGARRGNHRFQQIGRDINLTPGHLGHTHDMFLQRRNALDRKFARQIASVDQQTIGFFGNGRQIQEAVAAFDF